MEYIIGGIVVLVLVIFFKVRTARAIARNNDPAQQELLGALVGAARGELSEAELDEVIRRVDVEAQTSPHGVSGETIHTRLAHAASMATVVGLDSSTAKRVKEIARAKAVSF